MRALRLCPLVAGVLAAGALAPAAPPTQGRPDDPETARLRGQVERLRRERDLASGKGFYLRLDAAGRRLSLTLQGVALDDYPASGVEWGVPEVLFVNRDPGADWDAVPFSKGRLEPERQRDRLQVIAPAPAGKTAEPEPSPSPPAIPKSAEEAYSVPSPYRVVFAEGVSLEVRAKGEGGRNRSALRRFADAVSLRFSDLGTALGLGAKERVRLSVTLEAEDAAALYRSLPPDVGLIVRACRRAEAAPHGEGAGRVQDEQRLDLRLPSATGSGHPREEDFHLPTRACSQAHGPRRSPG